ncbi:hypothetical protein CONPUDRAFT_86214 [Coniophora puteana RWD-64-598 SS2]|uniref:DUF6533 domain-containing protein n=1 Tax=Coniophora puteana (strain RWD-64-598) TaxID=741705 RepID=A0A5M3N4A3_CONPW|nr:uncharacterized protein CONPUDRAFT_86214 [Coniophora puteana RWD-64-598 SS2]EIW86138.1 hypothetical protein CONPUDRAFT_86214 [Coniophora puteana RWD-64-598 SS2]
MAFSVDDLTNIAAGKQSDAVFDYCITIDKETKLVWGRKWDFGRVTFTLTRYLPFPGIALTVYAALQAVSLKPCIHNGTASNLLHIGTIVAAEGLLVMRTWAFWGCKKVLLIILGITAVVFIVAAMLITSHVNAILPKTVNPWPNACNFTTGAGSAIQYGFLVLYELILLSLVIYRWIRHYRSLYTCSKIVNAVYRDAVIYVSIMIIFSLGNIVNTGASPQYYNEYLDSLQVTVHSVLAARLFFHLRETNDVEFEQLLPRSIPTFRVAEPKSDSFDSESELDYSSTENIVV